MKTNINMQDKYRNKLRNIVKKNKVKLILCDSSTWEIITQNRNIEHDELYLCGAIIRPCEIVMPGTVHIWKNETFSVVLFNINPQFNEF